ncbi:MAG: YceI family protein [Acidimicrobiia bacterium]|nr:YceI family protein [Acidimicrobiia bacterium]
MSTLKRSLIVGALVILAVGGSALAWVWFSGGSGEPSTELTTPDIAGDTSTTSVDIGSTTTGDPGETPRGVSFVIDASQSVARFTLDEILRGDPNTVVGTTSEVAGQFVLDLDDLSATVFSPIVINARTLATDSSTRDRVMRGPIILDSANDEFEFITFEVTGVSGLEGPAVVGQELTFDLTGDLTIKGTTNEATFTVTATLTDDDTVTGIAAAQVLRSDFGIDIPNVGSVAGVTDEVTIQLEFTATLS